MNNNNNNKSNFNLYFNFYSKDKDNISLSFDNVNEALNKLTENIILKDNIKPLSDLYKYYINDVFFTEDISFFTNDNSITLSLIKRNTNNDNVEVEDRTLTFDNNINTIYFKYILSENINNNHTNIIQSFITKDKDSFFKHINTLSENYHLNIKSININDKHNNLPFISYSNSNNIINLSIKLLLNYNDNFI